MLEYIPLRLMMEVISLIPYRIVINIAKIIGFISYFLVPQMRTISLINLKQAFPEKTYKERKRIARRSIENMVMTFAEFIRSSRMSDKAILKRIKVEGIEKFDEALKTKKGIITITGHIGNWEYIAFYFGIKKYNPHVLVRPLDNPKLDKYLEAWRAKRGSVCVDRRGDLRIIFKALKENCPVAFLCDQNFIEGVYVNFFGYPAATPSGPIAMAVKTGAPVIIMYDIPDRKGRHKIVISDVFEIEKKETKEETITHNTQRYTKALEDIIRKYPENWLWVHPRWNTRPNGEPEIFYKNTDYK